SGSTGRPKGVAVPHRAVIRLVRLVRETDYVRLGPGDRIGQVANISFDAATWEVWGALLNGAAVVVIPRDVVLSPAAFAAALREQEVTALFLTTALFHRMAREVPDAFQGVRHLLFGGEAADPSAARAVLASRPPRRLLHVYGPTESTTFASWHLLRAVAAEAVSLPIGAPLANTSLYVLDRRLAAAPPGTPGELWIGGDGLAWGYWNRPELTAERFVPDPWAAGGRLYRTGDLVRRPVDGALEFLGRIDQQVKIRGFRIEPGEIEAALLSHPQVKSAVVLPRQDAGGGLVLAAYVAAAEEAAPGLSELWQWLLERLPAFMLPAAWVLLPSLPLTANGKVDRKALAKLRPERVATAGAGAAPRTPTEELVAGIFAEVLKLERVELEDDFFVLGGHSLLATQLTSRVLSVLGVELPVRTVFETPTAASLAAWIDERSSVSARAPLVRVSRGEPLVLSFAQQRLWFLDQMEPGSPLYNIPLAVELRGRLNPGVLAAVLGELVRRHETLRTRFAAGPVQVIDAAAPVALAVADLSGLPRAESRREEARLTSAEALRPFDLARGPLLRTLLLDRGEGDQVLVLSMHHIVSDGWSMGVLIREVGALYTTFLEGRPSPLPELAIQYADFAAWQRRYLAGDLLEQQLAWWREQLAGMPPVLELPADHPRPAVLSARGGAHSFAVDGETRAGLARLSRRHGATLFMTLLAGFAALLRRVAGEGSGDELAVGTPIAGRTRVEIEPLIGFFVNTLVLRADLSGDPDLVTLLGRVRETTLAAYAHQDLPFERLVEEIAPERDRSRAPLVQVVFALQNAVAGPVELPGLELRAASLPSGTAKFDLTLVLRETAEGLAGDVEYSRDLFDGATIERLAGRFERLLAGIVAAPRGPLSELPLLSAAERQQALVEWNDTAAAYPREACLPELFAAVARAMPDAPAIVVPAVGEKPAEVWTYGRLDAASNRLARHLQFQGVGPQTPVCLAMERSPELIVGILAILKAGGMYVPLDAGYPDERLVFMLLDAGATVVLLHAETRARLAGWVGLITMVAVDEGDWEREEDGPLGVLIPAESPAYVIYTSGSTGQPKGVAVPHQAIVRLVRETHFVRLGPGDRVGQVASISFDAATWEIWGALLNGATVVVIPRDVALSPPDLAAMLREQEVTSLFLTTALFTRMAREVPDAFAGVRDLLFGGEAADPSAARAVLESRASRPPRRLLHVYGPTESTTFASWHLLREVPPGATSLPIGAPLSNTALYVLDRRLAVSPPGTPGELWIGGDGLAWGYWNRPELTAERFVPDPWVAGGRLYRTGDLVRRPAGGALDFLGRIDQQVKIRGFRIEPGEVEAVLLSRRQVRSAVVLPREDAKGGLGLVAYVVAAAEEGAPGPPELRQWLLERLPAFMLPASWVLLPSLPLTANGKVDRKALAKLRPERVVSVGGNSAGVAAWTPTEELVAGIFAEVLSLEQVGLEDDFFALGGHSLLATQVASRVRSIFGLELPVRAVFEAPAVAGLARLIQGSMWGEERPSVPAPPLERAAREEPAALSFAQQRLWFLDQLEPGSPLYNVPVAVTLTGRLDRGALAAALGEVVRRHEILRTVFPAAGGRPLQLVVEPAGFAVPQIDLQGLPAGAREEEEGRLAAAEAGRPFDLGGPGSLLRAPLLRLEPERHVLLLNVHHIVSDGWSMGVLVRELGALYGAFVEGRPSPLPELAVQYADFAVWQRRRLSGALLEAELAWWRGALAGMPLVLELPADRPRPAVRGVRGAVHDFAIGGEGAAGLVRLSRRHGATLFMTLLAGFAVLLQRMTGEDDLAVGTPIAGRIRMETEPLIGLFVNTLALRVDGAGAPELANLLGRVRETTLSAYAHQEVPFERLVEELCPERDLSRPPLVQVMFSVQNAPWGPLDLPALALTASPVATGTAKFELTCTLTEREQGLAGAIEYSRDLFDSTTIERLAGRFVRLLSAAAADPLRPLPELPLLSAAERHQLLAEWNDTRAVYPLDACLHELFERQAERTPEAVAVVADDARLSFGELNARANRLARHLRRLGVAAEVPVALVLERSAALVVALLGVLKAGGAYLPVDPAYPEERQLDMLESSRAPIVLTRAARPELCSGLARSRVLLVDLDAVSEPIGEESAANPGSPVSPENLAYLLYTSGSTGRPKGTMISHSAVCNHMLWMQEALPLTAADSVLQKTPFSFDASGWEFWAPLLAGGCLVMARPGGHQDPAYLVEQIQLHRVTTLQAVPALLHLFLQEPRAAACTSLRRVYCGGEALSVELAESFATVLPAAELLNLYGPTEAAIDTSFWSARQGQVRGRVPIGRPIANARIYLLDRSLEPVPLGVPGLLCVGGEGLGRGYLGRPEMTAPAFIPDPWSGGLGRRLYLTGDLARSLPDGNVEFLGRVDRQVKVRGFRIEPGEIESVLSRHAAVQKAVVLLREDLPGGAGLAAYVVPASAASAVGPAELRDHLRQRLPAHMVPAAFVVVESLPLTPSGKVDRRKLALLDLERPAESAASAGVAPRTPAEELVAGIFAEVLKVERVGVTEDFFALGGHSLLATQVASRVRSVFGLELPVRTVFERPTVESLAAEVAAAGVEARPAAALPLARAEREGPPPLSFSQERIWFLQQLEPGSATYNMPLQVELSGSLRCGALPAALTEVVRRHESLRTAFVVAAGVPRQRISPASAFPLPLVDLSALSAADGVFAAERLGREHAGMAFDLESGPLFAALLVRLSEERHRFLLNLHHTIADGWSIQVLAQELGELYAASVEGRPGRLPELPIQYADFAVWQRRWLAETQEAELAYWESRLGGEIASAELPTDRPRPAVQTFRGGRCERVLPEDLAARLKRFGREESVTLFMTLLAATQALLSRHSGESDVAVGVPVAGRRWVETEGLIGCFLNTLVLRTDTSGQPGFRALAARVRTVTLEAYSHQTAPFEAVLARLDLHRDLSRSPLFQVLFNLLNLPAAEMSLPGLEPRALMPAEVPSKLDLTFYISEVEAGIGINLVYNADLFDAAHMEDFLAQLDLFLDQALETPEQPVTDLPLVTAAMRSVLPDPTLALDGSWIGSVYDLFAATAARAPGRTAVAHGADHAGVQTYGALLAASRCVAGWLAAQGVRRGDPVAILAVRTAPLVEAVLGVLGAGGAFVVLDAAYPALRQLEMLRLASPRAWISFASPGSEGAAPAEVLSWLREAGCACLDLPPGGAAAVEGLAPFAWEAPEVRVGPDDVACIGFTSGSTGGPKGILGLHGSLSHFLPAHCRQFDLGPDDRFSLLSGLGHDPLQREIFTPLYLGAAIAVPDPADYGISGRLAAWLCREQVTVSHLTPTLGQLLTELPPDGTRELVPSLRRVLLVGESLTRKDVARLRALAPGVSCINLYGSTETQRAVAFHPVTPEEAEAVAITERAQQVLPLGRGVQDVQLLVLTPAGGLAGLGELGEIAVRSPHLARGYLGNAELTAERFQANPFTPFPGNPPSDRIYRTGDLGRYRADGEVVFAGRLDQQVKVRGFRIELGEIEGVLAGLPGVLEAVVLLRTDLPGGAGLVAYVRTEEDRELSLRGELEARLPAYMVPASFVRLDKLPRTANGKLDRRALLRIAPELGGTSIRTLPRTPAEDLLAGIWSQVLGVDQIGVDQSFFELGGHSLMATQMASRVRDVFGVELPLRSLFLSPTLAGLTAEIERLRSGGTPERPTIASFRQDRGAPPPLSFAQERYWSGRHLEARSVASTIPMLIHLAGPLDRASLRRALAAVVDRHELLRTSFREGPEGPVQVIHPEVPVAFREVDLERLGAPERMAELRRLSALDGRMHFDYERPPLFRSTLFRGGPEEHVLLFTIHHVASDWWSTPILIREVAALYAAFCAGRPSPLPPLAAQFQDFARWQRRLSSEEEQASQVAFWREHLKGAVPVDLCNRSEGRPRPRQRSFTAGMEEIQVPQELERQLDAFSARQGVTLFMTLLAAFKALLHFETGQDDLVVPCSFANRNQLATERLIGNLATALPLRTRLSGVRTFRELLQRVRDVTLLAHDHPDIFWEPVVAGMSFLEEGDRGGLTTFRVLLQLLKVPRSAPAPPQAEIPFDVRVTPLSVDTGRMRLDLTLFLSQADRLAGRFRYNRDVLDETRVKGMRDRFLRILAAVVANPEHPLADLPFADPVPEEVERVDLALLS
ncbi:MAG TPA: amino acid adenylation domain-containing protein, partial [Thermoanaerobaculia bacterium]|nr:amino acid adenylation domain-containing protein [Thermoanaerobaculia bacterium]